VYGRGQPNFLHRVSYCAVSGVRVLICAFSGNAIPIHPLDFTSAEASEIKGTNMTTCFSMFEPFTSNAGGGRVDLILGDSFVRSLGLKHTHTANLFPLQLRNAYTVFNYGGLVNGFSGDPSSNPHVKIMPLTEPTAASAEFKKARAAQLATLPPQADVSTYNDVKPQAVQGSGTNAAGRLVVRGNSAIAAMGLATVLVIVNGCL
jgi:hypothetical protein